LVLSVEISKGFNTLAGNFIGMESLAKANFFSASSDFTLSYTEGNTISGSTPLA
jgi:hypothetical protein